ncbi:MAG: WYL domain-containing protein [Ruminococcus sp.]|nr:WYL domain-containing protein [Ruminococcus sp.]
MAGLSRQKQKLLTMKKLFECKTDENHSITGAKLIETLAQDGIKAERKTIYDDIKTLCDSGMDIEVTKDGHSNAYYLAGRTFQDEELFVLADAVASCRFLTKKKSQELIKKIQTLTSEHKAKQLRRLIYVDNRTKNFNEQIYYAINKIQAGIFDGLEIKFRYTEFNPDKKQILKHGGEVYSVSPYSLVWENENYYLVCYCNKHEKICRYRVDRMVNVEVSDVSARPMTDEDKLEVANMQSLYGMYGGELMSVTMQFDNSLANVVIDKFGLNCHPHRNSEDTFCLTADVQIAPTFWGWFFQFGSKAKIIAPESAVEQAKQYIDVLSANYK